MTAELQRGLGWSSPLLSLKAKYCLIFLLSQIEVKILFDDSTYCDDDDATEADKMMDVVYEEDSDDDKF